MILIILGVGLLFAGYSGLKVLKAIGWEMLIFHFVRGADFRGKHKTNATWLHNATWENHRDYAHISEWNHLARLPRVLWRLGTLVTVLAFAIASFESHVVFSGVLIPFGCFLGLSFILSMSHRFKRGHHERDNLGPLISAIAQEFQITPARARKLLNLPKEALSMTNGVIGTVDLPGDYIPSDNKRAAFGRLLSDHVNKDVEVEWQVASQPRRAVIRVAGRPPDTVLLSEYEHYILHAEPGDIFLGVDRFRQPYYRNLNAGEDPHWAFAVRSGAGKTTFLGMLILQVLAQDPESLCVSIDPKGVSLAHLEGIPGFVYFSNHQDVTEMWEGIAGFRRILDDRIEARKYDPDIEFPPALLLIDELPRFTDMTADAWREVSPRGYAPVWKDIRAVLQMGREFNLHVVAMAIRLDDRSTGIQGTRSYFSFRGLSGYKDNDWSMLIGTNPVPVAQKGSGRWIYVADDEKTWVQNVVPDGTTRTEICTSMREWADKHVSPRQMVFEVAEDDSRRVTQGNVSPISSNEAIKGLKNGAEFLGLTYNAFLRARNDKPIPGEKKDKRGRVYWDENDLTEWQKSRPRAGKSIRAGK